MRTGARNLLTDVPGLVVGNAQDEAIRSGVTVVLSEDDDFVAAVDIRGGGTGTRETAALAPEGVVPAVHGIVLSGGSAFGLDAAGGAMTWLAAQGRGFAVGAARVPVVPQAILFDLLNGGDKGWAVRPDMANPYRALAVAACAAAGADFALGTAGAGYGAMAGGLKGGLGSTSIVHESGLTVGALAAVNARGSVLLDGSAAFNAWAVERDGEYGAVPPPVAPLPDPDWNLAGARLPANTTLAIVATDLALDKAQVQRLATMAQAGLARAIRPVWTPLDGDVVFAVATGRRALRDPVGDLALAGALAADCLARAAARGVYKASDLGAMRCYREIYGSDDAT
ncbi:MAG: peptidase S58 family protein [Alphaproteobacteria bacterium]|nr:peptidase S58 family protein [Alphaproteobacteria bacterium]